VRPCLSQSTLLRVPTEAFLEAAARAGFGDVELRFSRLEDTLAFRRAREIRGMLSRLGVRCAALNSLEEFSLFPDENVGVMDHLVEAMCETCRLLEVPLLIVVPSRLAVPLPWEDIHARTVSRLRRYAERAVQYGVTLALEPIGAPGFSVRTTAAAIAIVDEVDRENVRIALDTMNAYLGGDPPAAWEAVPPELLAIVHFHDSEPGPVETLTLGSRVLPGDGIIDLRGYAAALHELRYAGPLSVELFNERLWQMPPEAVARMAMESLRPFLS
jgi:sugar phosphate isomerase/epimerase